MKWLFFLLLLQPQGISDDLALSAANALQSTLMDYLHQQTQAHAEPAAIRAFTSEVRAMVRKSAREQRLLLARLGDRPLNPTNAPVEAEVQLFAQMRQDAQDNRLRSVYELEDAKYVPLIADKACLSCHGKSPSPAIKTELASLFPTGNLDGFLEAELIGAIRVKKNAHLDHD